MAVVQHPVDFVGEYIHPAGISEQKRILERLQAVDKNQDRDAENGGRQHRKRDGEERLVSARPERDRRLLIRRIHGLKETDQHQEYEGNRMKRRMEDQAAPSVEIDDVVGRSKPVASP